MTSNEQRTTGAIAMNYDYAISAYKIGERVWVDCEGYARIVAIKVDGIDVQCESDDCIVSAAFAQVHKI
jgi:hypothetical protein